MHVSGRSATIRSSVTANMHLIGVRYFLYRYRVQYDRPFILVKCQTGNQAKIPQISLCLNPQRIEYVLLFFQLSDTIGGSIILACTISKQASIVVSNPSEITFKSWSLSFLSLRDTVA